MYIATRTYRTSISLSLFGNRTDSETLSYSSVKEVFRVPHILAECLNTRQRSKPGIFVNRLQAEGNIVLTHEIEFCV